MKTIALIPVVLTLAGCAMSYERQIQEARTDTNEDLCLVQIVKPRYAAAAQQVLRERGHYCDWGLAQARAASRDAANAQLLQQSLQLMKDSGPRTIGTVSPPRQTNCRTVYHGSTSDTQCW